MERGNTLMDGYEYACSGCYCRKLCYYRKIKGEEEMNILTFKSIIYLRNLLPPDVYSEYMKQPKRYAKWKEKEK
jgi:hypothetical protein